MSRAKDFRRLRGVYHAEVTVKDSGFELAFVAGSWDARRRVTLTLDDYFVPALVRELSKVHKKRAEEATRLSQLFHEAAESR